MRLLVLIGILLVSSTVAAGMDISGEIKEVIISGENPFFIHIGKSTKSILTERSGVVDSCKIEFKAGDAPQPIGNGEAEMHAIIICKGYATIGLRLKSANNDHYHILGYWTFSGS